MDTTESDFDNENPGVVLGTHDDLEIVTVDHYDGDDDGIIYDDDAGASDFIGYDTGSGFNWVQQDSTSIYNADVLLGDGSTMTMQVIVVQAVNGDVFVADYSSGDLSNVSIQSIELTSLDNSNFGGIFQGAYGVNGASIVCILAGTMITTDAGEKPVETLRPGDLVATLDRGLQPVRWVRQDKNPIDSDEHDTTPIEIVAGALGDGKPATNTIVSPQHRILVGGQDQLQDLFETEALAPAKPLTTLRGVRRLKDQRPITWVHFAFDQHEIVYSNGCLTESLLLGPLVVKGLRPSHRQTVITMFGLPADEAAALNGPPARECLHVGQVRKHLKSCLLVS